MKLMYFNDYKLGVIKGEAVVDVSAVVQNIAHTGPHDLINGLIERFAEYRPRLEEATARDKGVPLADVKVRPPLPKPVNIDCMAVNYMEDGTRTEPAPINAFHKSPNAVIGPEDTMVLPDVPATIFEGEAEVAVVIGKRAKDVKAADAMSHVFGYVNFVDGSARGLPPPGNVFYQMKSRDTFAPIGPYIVTADEIRDPHQLQVRLWVNGVLKQNFNTSDMAHKIPRCIEWVSSIHTLEPGDVLATGTNHRGLSSFQDGDVVELESDGLGRLRFHVRDELKRTWGRETRLDMANKGSKGNNHAAADREVRRAIVMIARVRHQAWPTDRNPGDDAYAARSPLARRGPWRSMSISSRTDARSSSRLTAAITSSTRAGGMPAAGIGAELALDLRTRERVLERSARMLAARLEGRAVGHLDLHHRLRAGQRGIVPDLHALLREPAQLRVVVARGLELGERERAVVQDHRRGVVAGDQRVELALVAGKLAVHVESGLAQRHAHRLDLGGVDAACCSTRSNSAVFMPCVSDADGHSRSAICSSSQRWPRSAVTASGWPPLA